MRQTIFTAIGRQRHLVILGLTSALLTFACGQAGAPAEETLDDVQVDLGPTKTLTVEDDQQGYLPAIEDELSGVLPSDFPADIPLPTPASITDLSGGTGPRFVELSVPRQVDDVRVALNSRLRGAGWSQKDPTHYTHSSDSSRTIEVVVRGDGNGATVRVDYTAAR